ncbi:metal transporter Nramp5-like [Zingiber officinale]|uniref:metal transporter Nramp5-like n=1 Tax=Zingiber officinale TaxID=94328 RepID=UPI001C4C05F7|nr:metal transporter Nramp5-like [Zingiber officinale]
MEYITSIFIEETTVLKRDIIVVIQKFNIQVSNLTQDVLGKSSSTVYAIALLASGQSSAITGTYAGQYIMQGFLNMKMKKWLRNLMTRSIAITPSLIVSIISGSLGAEWLIIISSMVLSFEFPFALLSLLKFSSSQTKMGPHKSSIHIIVVSWILGLLRVAINIYFLSTSFVSWLIDSSLPAVANVLISIIVFPLMAVYILAVIYLTFRKETEVTFVDPWNSSHVNIESGVSFQVDGMSRS